MFSSIFKFEIKTWFRTPITYIYSGIMFIFAFILMASSGGLFDNFTVTTTSATFQNSALAINGLINIIAVFLYFLLPSIIGASVSKDFKYDMHQVLYSYPITKFNYLFAKFLSALSIVIMIILFICFGLFLGTIFPGTNPKLFMDFDILNYVQPLLLIILPNLIFFGAVVFAVVTFSRNIFIGFISILILIVIQSLAQTLAADVDNKTLAALIDPLGAQALSLETEYWTVFDRNTNYLPFEGYLLYNRLLWAAISILIFVFVYVKFKFNQQAIQFRLFKTKAERVIKRNFGSLVRIKIPEVSKTYKFKHWLKMAWTHSRFETKYIFKNWVFISFALVTVLVTFITLAQRIPIYGTSTYPVTREMMQSASGIISGFMTIITFLISGMLINRAQNTNMNQLVDVTPYPNWSFMLSKFFAIFKMQAFFYILALVIAIGVQIYNDYYKLEIDLYLFQFFAVDYLRVFAWTAMAFLVHVLIKNHIVGFITLLAGFIFLSFLPSFGIEQYIFRFNTNVGATYSDMVGYGTSLKVFYIYRLYWFALATVMYVLALLFYRRGLSYSVKQRFERAKQNFNPLQKSIVALSLLLFISIGSWIYYTDNIVNTRYSGNEVEQLRVDFENQFSKYKELAQPRITSVNIDFDLYPETRDFKAKGEFILKNKTESPMDSVFINMNDYPQSYAFEKAGKVVLKDTLYDFEIFKFNENLSPGEEVKFTFEMENEPNTILTSNSPVRTNGTFINNQIFPSFGYNENREIQNNKTREKYGLEPKERMNSPYDSTALGNTYISSDADWIDFETTVSTSKDQIAIAPGYLQKEWIEGERKYFNYKMDKKILNFYAFNSAEYEVYEDRWNDVNIQVFYHKPHDYNIERMVNATKKSLAYYSENFSPYQFKQLRILEFPVTSGSFAQSFANTVPYSEAIGFIAKVDDEDNESVDYPFSVTAHEVAHQWWAHQVIGANVRGATLLSESMSEYSSLKVLEKEYGAEQMRVFLKDALDKYLRGRRFESQKELPLMYNENQQYIHYNKGSLVLYAMSDYLGEKKMNNILKTYVDQVAFQEPPYTTSVEFVNLLKSQTPDSLQYLIKDMFETITLYDNQALKATYKVLENGQYEVNFEVNVQKYRSSEKGEKEFSDAEGEGLVLETDDQNLESLPLKDYIEVGVFGKSDESLDDVRKENVLYLKKHLISEIKNNFSIIVDNKPFEAGIDPFNKLIDTDSDDNRIKVTEE
ncbi:ABC-type transporter permease and M1 family peptidase domains [Psychroflexus gondwanensis ACAM 44]|uniref:ABC-type transporter permease and M1 family peptidase domains n=1 Tax=Psychroflexus gondwanensis ACAM 44 TaxID=1189619 RepID=N1WSM3_9FLAO|nr:M1 family aminopeptidase [Psychroflexus gondwanensis]EMY80227.1 ABC-type transporter permease and M1 family peptidase domains [Psychroflexus gondwanensis ACAM 44]